MKLFTSLLIVSMTLSSTLVAASTASTEIEEQEKLCTDNSCDKQISKLKKYAVLYKNPAALILLASAYMTGEGVDKNPIKAYKLIKRASNIGSPKAHFMLSAMIRDGVGTNVDLARSSKFLDRAAKQGYAPAMFQKSLETLDFTKSDNTQAIIWLEKAVEGRSKDAIYLMAQLKETGTVVPKDILGAAKLYKQAAFWQYKDSTKRLQHLALITAKDSDKYQQIAKLAQDVETITVHGNKLDFQAALDMKIEAIALNSDFDGRNSGSHIPGGCSIKNNCKVIFRSSDNKHGSLGLQSLTEMAR